MNRAVKKNKNTYTFRNGFEFTRKEAQAALTAIFGLPFDIPQKEIEACNRCEMERIIKEQRMSKKKNRNTAGAFGGGRKKIPNGFTPKEEEVIKFDLSGEAFDPNASVECIPHGAPNFEDYLGSVHWYDEWVTIWHGLLAEHQKDPQRPHVVYEAFIRGNRGYVPMIALGTAPDGDLQVRGMIYSCGINTGVSEKDVLEALLNLGASALTQLLSQNDQPFIKWERPQ